MSRVVLAAAALILAANPLSAQITTYIPPHRAPLPNPQMVATADSVRRDSVQQATMTNMKAWVDSAAGVAVPAHVGEVDSTTLANDPGRPDLRRPVVTTFSNGSVAPATASSLPTLALFGFLSLLLGAWLLATRPRG